MFLFCFLCFLLFVVVILLGGCVLFVLVLLLVVCLVCLNYDLVVVICVVGDCEKLIIDVSLLCDLVVIVLQDGVCVDECVGCYLDVVVKFNQVFKFSFELFDLLQDCVEIVVCMCDFLLVEKLVYQLWLFGLKLGLLCVCNWQIVVEMCLQVDDSVGVVSVCKWVQICYKVGINCY